jgi:hypothetical protein
MIVTPVIAVMWVERLPSNRGANEAELNKGRIRDLRHLKRVSRARLPTAIGPICRSLIICWPEAN